jgi:hypothetical protein
VLIDGLKFRIPGTLLKERLEELGRREGIDAAYVTALARRVKSDDEYLLSEMEMRQCGLLPTPRRDGP